MVEEFGKLKIEAEDKQNREFKKTNAKKEMGK